MNAVFAASLELAQQFDLIETVVAIGVAQPIEPAVGVFVNHHIKAVECVQQSVRLADRQINRLVLDGLAAANRRRHHSIKLSVLIGHNQSPLGIDTHGHP